MSWKNTEEWKKFVENKVSNVGKRISSLENVSLSLEGKSSDSIAKEAKMKFQIREFFGDLINNFSKWFVPYCKLVKLTEERLESNDKKDEKNGKFTSMIYSLMKETRENLHKLRQAEGGIAKKFLESIKKGLNQREFDHNEKIIEKVQNQFSEILKKAKQNLTKIKNLGKKKDILLLNSLRNSVAYGGDKDLNDRHKTSFWDVLGFIDSVLNDEKNWLSSNIDKIVKEFEDLRGRLSEPFRFGDRMANSEEIKNFCIQSIENISNNSNDANGEIVDSFLEFKKITDNLFYRAFNKLKNDMFEQVKSNKFDISEFKFEMKGLLKHVRKKVDSKLELIGNKFDKNDKKSFESLRDVIIENAVCKGEISVYIDDSGMGEMWEDEACLGVASIGLVGLPFATVLFSLVMCFPVALNMITDPIAATLVSYFGMISIGAGFVATAVAATAWIGYKIFRRIKEKKMIKEFEKDIEVEA